MPVEVTSSLAIASFFVAFIFGDGILTEMIKEKN